MATYMCQQPTVFGRVIPLGPQFYLEANWHGLIHIIDLCIYLFIDRASTFST